MGNKHPSLSMVGVCSARVCGGAWGCAHVGWAYPSLGTAGVRGGGVCAGCVGVCIPRRVETSLPEHVQSVHVKCIHRGWKHPSLSMAGVRQVRVSACVHTCINTPEAPGCRRPPNYATFTTSHPTASVAAPHEMERKMRTKARSHFIAELVSSAVPWAASGTGQH